MNDRYRLVFHGQYRPGYNPSDVITRLCDTLGATRLRVSSLLAHTPAIVREGLDLAAAKQLYYDLSDAGLLTLLEADEPQKAIPWDGVERRMGERRASEDRRRNSRGHTGLDRRKGDRRKNPQA